MHMHMHMWRARALSLGCLSTQFSSVCIVISGGKKLVGARARALSLSDVCVLNTQVSACQITGGQSNKTDTTRADTLAHRTARMRLIGTT